MANRFARKNGNWDASDVWSDTPSGTASASFIPTTGDVAMSNSFTVTVNVDATCAEVRNDTTGGATAGGLFDLASGVTLTANVYAGTTRCVRFASASTTASYIVGNVRGGTLANGNANGISITASGTLVIIGEITGGSASTCHGVSNDSGGTLLVTGGAVGGSGGNGINNVSTGTVTLNGYAKGGVGSLCYGAANGSSGTLNVTQAIGNDFGNGSVGLSASPGVTGSQTGLVKVRSIQYGSRGQTPTAGNVYIEPDNGNQAIFVKSDLTTITLARTDTGAYGNPAASDVRYGTVYALGNLTGTCHVPTASQVASGVAVDATTGTAVLTEANVRAAIGLASANLDTQLAAIPTDGLTAQQVWEYATRTLTAGSGITAQDVWEYATREITGGTVDTLTNSPDVPTESEIAAQVRVELTPELSRVANCATVESTGDQLAGLL